MLLLSDLMRLSAFKFFNDHVDRITPTLTLSKNLNYQLSNDMTQSQRLCLKTCVYSVNYNMVSYHMLCMILLKVILKP